MSGELFTRFASQANLSPSARRWNGNDETDRNHHGLVPIADNPLEISLCWKTSSNATPKPIGFYRLYLSNLQAAGFVGPTKNGHVRLRFFHDMDDCIYIELLSKPRKRLLIGKYV